MFFYSRLRVLIRFIMLQHRHGTGDVKVGAYQYQVQRVKGQICFQPIYQL